MDIKGLIEEMEEARHIRIQEIKEVKVGSSSWFYLEGAITTLANLLYYCLVKENDK